MKLQLSTMLIKASNILDPPQTFGESAMRNDTKTPLDSRRGRTLLIVGVCKPGLAILTIAYLLLFLSVILGILMPHSLAGKVTALIAYTLVAGFFCYKSYKAMNAPTVKAKVRKDAKIPTGTGGQSPDEAVTVLSIEDVEPPMKKAKKHTKHESAVNDSAEVA